MCLLSDPAVIVGLLKGQRGRAEVASVQGSHFCDTELSGVLQACVCVCVCSTLRTAH